MTIAGIVFDAYGTLFDVYAVEALLELHFPTKGKAIATRWRDKQISYSQLRTLSGHYTDFWHLTADALDYACAFEHAPLDADTRAALLELYERLPPHPDVPAALQTLAARGLPLGILSNGNGTMLAKIVEAAGLTSLFTHILSVELGPDAFGHPAADLLFVSSNGWDAAGAAWFGYRCFWLNRAGAPPERLNTPPIATGRSMNDLLAYLAGASPC
jgi:2-haloacid dehalogenase